MTASYSQKIVTITTNDPVRNTKFSLTNREQLDELERNYRPDEVASIDVEFINDKESLGGNMHRSVTNKHYDSLEHFLVTARLRYTLA